MELQYFGANCLKITTKKASIIIDCLPGLSTKSMVKPGDTVLLTEPVDNFVADDAKLIIDKPGEYEVGDTAVLGIPAKSYKGESNTFNNTIFKVENDEVSLAIIGNVSPELSGAQLELLGEVDVVVIPVGGNDTELSGTDALSITRNIEPFIIIPTSYDDKKTKYTTPHALLSDALKEIAMEPSETVPKLKLKSANFVEGDNVKLIVLES